MGKLYSVKSVTEKRHRKASYEEILDSNLEQRRLRNVLGPYNENNQSRPGLHFPFS